jgi:hypothetical protein
MKEIKMFDNDEEYTTGWHLWTLRPGDQIRVSEGTPIRTVTHVSIGSANYEIVSESSYDVFDSKRGEIVTLTRRNRRTTYIAARSFVEMIERGPVNKSETWTSLVPTETEEVSPKPRPELPPIKYKKARRKRHA